MSFDLIILLIALLTVFLVLAHAHIAHAKAIHDAKRKVITDNFRAIDDINELYLYEGTVPIPSTMRYFLDSAIRRRLKHILSIDPKNKLAHKRIGYLNSPSPISDSQHFMTDEEILNSFKTPTLPETRKIFVDGIKAFKTAVKTELKECPQKVGSAKRESENLMFLQIRMMIDIYLERVNAAIKNDSFTTATEILADIHNYLLKLNSHAFPQYCQYINNTLREVENTIETQTAKRDQRIINANTIEVTGDGLERVITNDGKTKW